MSGVQRGGKPRVGRHARTARRASCGVPICALMLSGCAVGPQFHRPAAPQAAGYSPTLLEATSAFSAIHGGEVQHLIAGRDIDFRWWRTFQSPALNALVEKAFQANPTITAAQAALCQAQELVYAQRGFFFPTIDALYQAERHKVPGNNYSSSQPGIQANGDNLTTNGTNRPLYYTFHTAGLTVGFVPDVLGGNRRQVEALAAQADAQRYALEATYVTLASNVVAAVIQEASLRAQITATVQIADAQTQSLKILREQFRLGYAMRIDVAAQEAALAQTETLLPPLRKALEQTRDLLRALTGKLPDAEAGPFELDALQLPAELPVSLPARIVEQRPDVRAAEAQLRSANAQVGVAVAEMLPQFSISGEAGGSADQIPWMFRTGGTFWSVVGDVSQPIFTGGTLLHREGAASAALQQAAAQYQNTVTTAYQNVADTLHATLSDARSLAADVEAEEAAKVTYDLTHRQMEAGYVNYLAVLGAEIGYRQALLTRVQAQAMRFGDTVALFQALGGGWWNRPEIAAR
jgi:NodT family efflux transporter outer membrane factor (OMF) lipoprotein